MKTRIEVQSKYDLENRRAARIILQAPEGFGGMGSLAVKWACVIFHADQRELELVG